MENKNTIKNIILKFLCWCSGATYEVLKTCKKEEQNKYALYGCFVLITTAVSSISCGYFIYKQITQDLYLISLFTAIWAFFIFTADRYLISTVQLVPLNKSKISYTHYTPLKTLKNKNIHYGYLSLSLLVLAILGFIIGFFVYYQQFLISALLGVLLSILMLNISRYTSKEEIENEETIYCVDYKIMLPRMLLAFILAYFMAIPIKTKMFNEQIRDNIEIGLADTHKDKQEAIEHINKPLIKAQEDKVTALISDRCDHIQKEIDVLIKDINTDTKDINDERDKGGCGRICRDKKEDKVEKEGRKAEKDDKLIGCRQDVKKEKESIEIQTEIDKLDKEIDKVIQLNKDEIEDIKTGDKPLTIDVAYITLMKVAKNNSFIALLVFLISLILLTFETLPLLMKMMIKPGQYELKVHRNKLHTIESLKRQKETDRQRLEVHKQKLDYESNLINQTFVKMLDLQDEMIENMARSLKVSLDNQAEKIQDQVNEYDFETTIKTLHDTINDNIKVSSFKYDGSQELEDEKRPKISMSIVEAANSFFDLFKNLSDSDLFNLIFTLLNIVIATISAIVSNIALHEFSLLIAIIVATIVGSIMTFILFLFLYRK